MSTLNIGDMVIFEYKENGDMVGTLVDINSRYATVEVDGAKYKVGKNMVEAFFEPVDEDELNEPASANITAGYAHNYTVVRAASGKKSLDNDDPVAHMLRGQDLESVYDIANDVLGVPVKTLKKMYSHLNPGQQRMVLGNRIRGFYKSQK